MELVAEAERFLLSRPIELVTRKMYFDAAVGSRRKIPSDEVVADGRVLAVWGDSGWGKLVRQGKLHTGSFDDRLVSALAELVEEWSPEPIRSGSRRSLPSDTLISFPGSPSGSRIASNFLTSVF